MQEASVLTGSLIHGTAERGSGRPLCTAEGLASGYRAIDSAPSPAHDEDAIGSQIEATMNDPPIKLCRGDVVIQTKFSPATFYSQSPELCPFQLGDIIPVQVLKSIASSLSRLRIDYIDTYMLHRPLRTLQQTFAAWEVMEEIVRQGGAKQLGLCQTDLPTLKALCQRADIKPVSIQNHFSKRNDYDSEVRQYCKTQGLIYQAFGVLDPENKALLAIPSVVDFAHGHNVSFESSLFAHIWASATFHGERFCILDGSRSAHHMIENQRALDRATDITSIQIDEFDSALKRMSAQ